MATGRIKLYLQKTASKSQANVGEVVDFNIIVRNDDAFLTANNVELTDTLPDGSGFISATKGGNPLNVTPVGNELTIQLGNLSPGATVNITIKARLNLTGVNLNTATAGGSNTIPSNDSASVNVQSVRKTRGIDFFS